MEWSLISSSKKDAAKHIKHNYNHNRCDKETQVCDKLDLPIRCPEPEFALRPYQMRRGYRGSAISLNPDGY